MSHFTIRLFPCLLIFAFTQTLSAQHEEHHPPSASTSSETEMNEAMPAHSMSSAVLPGQPMSRDASGTGWLPESSPVYGVHSAVGSWMVMFHGAMFARYANQDALRNGARGDREFGMPHWSMAMAQHSLGSRRQVALRAMFSLDPITEGKDGYPLLFQTGETFQGKPLVDRQHPHDFFAELAAIYGQSFGERTGAFLYLAMPGEPALGPPAFMHRPSAQHNPNAPLGHHMHDATHITFGVATVGVQYDIATIDASIFTGREPDENRFDLDRPRLDSGSLRVSVNPTKRFAMQVSRGFLKSPNPLESEEDIWRTTASVIHNMPCKTDGNWATSLVWGMNSPADAGGDEREQGWLLESDLDFNRFEVHSRMELVQRTPEDLGIAELDGQRLSVGALTFGGGYHVLRRGDAVLTLGAQGTVHRTPATLKPVYGDVPVSFDVYLRLAPKRI